MKSISLASHMTAFSLDSDCLTGQVGVGPIVVLGSFGKKYKVSLPDQTCSCPDFVETRSNRPKDHFSRWCKHIVRAASEAGAFKDASLWVKAITAEGMGGPIAAFLISPPDGQQFLTTIGNSREWINVYVRTPRPGEKLPHLTGPVKEYGWGIGGKRWSYGVAPRGAGAIRKLISQIEGINEE